jgi:hypothetical protein
MINREKRKEDLDALLINLNDLCSENDLRLGQVIDIAMNNTTVDLFTIENDKLNDLILENFKDWFNSND